MQYANQEPDDKDPSTFSAFKKAEKKYRVYNKKTTDLTQLLDLDKWDENLKSICTKQEIIDPDSNKVYQCFEFAFPQGLFVIKDFLTIKDQIETSFRCLNEYHKKPHRTNMYIYEPNEVHKDEPLPTYDITKFLVNDPEKYYFNKKIRWANLGYHYDWNERKYPKGKTNIPDEMKHLPMKVIKLMKYNDYYPESVIINYYDKKNYMGGHLDDGELDQVSPIISFSMGLSCVFLIGGPTRDTEPHAIKLDSGDVMIMAGKSRGSVHGVPRVLEGTFEKEKFMNWLKENKPEVFENHNKELKREEDGSFINDEIHVINYLSEDRINFNFRQVYLKDEKENENKEVKYKMEEKTGPNEEK